MIVVTIKRIKHVNSLDRDLCITKCDYQNLVLPLLLFSLNFIGRGLNKRYEHYLIQPHYVRQESLHPLRR